MSTGEKVENIFGNGVEMFDFAANNSRNRKPLAIAAAVRAEVTKICCDKELWASVLPHLREPGKAGSTQFDHHAVVERIKAYDLKHNGGALAAYNLTDMELWQEISKVQHKTFAMRRGFITGLLEHVVDDKEAAKK